jgi:hypothetical protein
MQTVSAGGKCDVAGKCCDETDSLVLNGQLCVDCSYSLPGLKGCRREKGCYNDAIILAMLTGNFQ